MSTATLVPPMSRDIDKTPTLSDQLFDSGFEFDFFQAVSILENMYSDRTPVGYIGRELPAARFAAHASSFSFAASSIYEIEPATGLQPTAKLTVNFMGLTGPSGILPQHYSELLRRIEIESNDDEKYALRDWFDLFNDRLIALFYRSWKKYRLPPLYAQSLRGESDGFTTVLQSACGLGMPTLSHQVSHFLPQPGFTPKSNRLADHSSLQTALLRYAGILAQRPRSASNLKQLLVDYFQVPFDVEQFYGNWLTVDPSGQTELGVAGGNNILGQNAIVGDQTWERQNKILITVGPVAANQFLELLPDSVTESGQNDFQLLTDLVRLFVGPEIEFDVQVQLLPDELPDCQLNSDHQSGMRLGWNTWLPGRNIDEPVCDATFCTE